MAERLSVYSETLTKFEKAMASRGEAEGEVSKHWRDAVGHLRELRDLRVAMLEEILEAKRLAICSDREHYGVSETEEEKLGIFSKDQMRLLYRSKVVWRGSEGYQSKEREEQLELLCPYHFPADPNKVEPSEELWTEKRGLDIVSEVVEREGRLVTVVNSIDVTDLPIEKYYSEGVYRHFGLAKLPELPRF